MTGDAVTADSALEPYERLVAMIEHELKLLAEGRLDDLGEAVTRRGELLAALPAEPPAGAEELFDKARLLHERVIAETTRAGEALQTSLAGLRRIRQAAAGYRPPRRRKYSTTA